MDPSLCPLMRDFAQELVDQVLDNVAATANTRDIGTCGRVCRRWLPRTRMHLFSSITLRNALSNDEEVSLQTYWCSNIDHNTAQPFFHFIESASMPMLPLVRTLHLRRVLHVPWVSEQHMRPLQNCRYLRELHIDGLDPWEPSHELEFVQWVHTHIPRFGAACPSLTRLDLGLPGHLPLNVLADLMSALPFLTELRLRSSPGHYAGIDAFPPHLHKLDVELYRGTSLLFRWLLSHTEPPIFTTLRLGGCNRYEPIDIDAYLRRFGPRIESLALAYIVEEEIGGWSLKAPAPSRRAFSHSPHGQCISNSRRSHPRRYPPLCCHYPQPPLTLKVGVYSDLDTPLPDWSAIDRSSRRPSLPLCSTSRLCIIILRNTL
ncbi:hypothetical protein B0H13DRAFT_2342639 [Mycena leptocephala]|nr:hypothetical protein B0H13DRAFT_2342639 [Mycena leptocephala]